MDLVRHAKLLVALSLLLLTPALLAASATAARALPPLTQQEQAASGAGGVSAQSGQSGVPLAGRAAAAAGRPASAPSASVRSMHPVFASWFAFSVLALTLVGVATTPLWLGRRRHARLRRAGGMPDFPPSYYRCEDWQEAECCRSKTRA